MTDVELAIRMTADVADATKGFDSVGDAAGDMATEVDRAADKADAAGSKMGSVSDAADNLGSSTSQAAGGLGDLGGALSVMPGPLGAVGSGMETLGPLVQGVTGATDLMTLAMNSNIVMSVKQKAATVANAVAQTAASAASKAAAAGQWLLNAALSANPIGAVVLLVVALVAGVVLAYKKSETFRQIVDGAMAGAKAAIQTVVDVFGTIKDVIKDVADKVPGMSGVFDTASTLIKGYIELWLTPLRLVKEAIEWIIDNLKKIDLPDLGGLTGGLLGRTSGRGVVSGNPRVGGGDGQTININLPGAVLVGSEAEVARYIRRILGADLRRFAAV